MRAAESVGSPGPFLSSSQKRVRPYRWNFSSFERLPRTTWIKTNLYEKKKLLTPHPNADQVWNGDEIGFDANGNYLRYYTYTHALIHSYISTSIYISLTYTHRHTLIHTHIYI